MQSILLLNRNDYLLAQNSLGAKLLEMELVTHAADTYNLFGNMGIANATMVDVIAPDQGSLFNCHYEADRIARAFDARLSELRTRHLRFDTDSLGWDYMNTYFIALTTLRWRRYAPALVDALPPRDGYSFIFINSEQDFYFDSSLQRQFIIDAFRRSGRPGLQFFVGHSGKPFVADAAHFDLALGEPGADGAGTALCHLPSTYYDYERHRAELAERHGAGLLDLESPYWDLPIAAKRVLLARFDGYSQPASIAQRNYQQAVRATTTDLYNMLCPGNPIVAAQVERQVSRSMSQLKVFDKLCTAPHFANIRTLHVADHDAGLSGPLATWANMRNVATEIHPHSSFCISPFPPIKDSVKHGYCRTPDAYVELGLGRARWDTPLPIGAPTTRAQPLVLLVLNALIDPGGVPTCEFARIGQFTLDVIALCRKLGVPCKVRSKHTWDFSRVLVEYWVKHGLAADSLGDIFATGPLDEWVAPTSLCIGVEQVSTALSKFLADGVPCIQAYERGYSEAELHTLPENGVDVLSYSATLERLATQFA